MLPIKKTPTFATSDGTQFTDRGDAVKHEIYLTRVKQLAALSLPEGHLNDSYAEFIAKNGDAILEALTVKQNRGRSKSAATQQSSPAI